MTTWSPSIRSPAGSTWSCSRRDSATVSIPSVSGLMRRATRRATSSIASCSTWPGPTSDERTTGRELSRQRVSTAGPSERAGWLRRRHISGSSRNRVIRPSAYIWIVFLRIATLALAQALDLATFAVMVARHGPLAEANPVVADLYGEMGMPAVALAKFALVLLVAGLVL